MSLQGAVEDSGSLKSRLREHNLITRLFSFERTGSLKDRLLTALMALAGALLISVVAVHVPYGGLLCIAVAVCIAGGSVFEVVRLFARDSETLRYKPILGSIYFCILLLPTLAAALVAIRGVSGIAIDWRVLYGAIVVSGQGLMLAQVMCGRNRLEDASRFVERYGSSFFLLGVCAPQLVVLSGLPFSVPLLWWMVGVVALNDATAYFVGSAVGARKMAPGLSPNKSIEGSVAGLAVGVAAGVFLWQLLLGDGVSLWRLVLISLSMTIAAQSGDLSKSYLKRLRGVKDMGAIFPGHGGILDRFDALIAASPVVLVSLLLMGLV